MDPTNITSPILRIPSLPSYQSGGQQQRTPFSFSQGQFLQGVISAKSGQDLFTIDISGHQVLAESTTPLQIGQKLTLQVASLVPQVELQIVSSSNSVNRMIGNSIHLIGQQAPLLNGLTDLAERSGLLPQLSRHSKETLHVYADSLVNRSLGGPVPLLPTQLSTQLLSKTIEAFAAQQNPALGTLYEEIGNLLQQLTTNAALSGETADQATRLATVFSKSATVQSSTGSTLPTETVAATPLSTEETVAILNQLIRSSQENPQLQDLIRSLITILHEDSALPASHPLQQLVAFLVRLHSADFKTQRWQMDGKQLQEIVDRLGVNMEQLLADDQREEAVQTLKFALLELSQHVPAGDKSSNQASQLAKSIELYQLLQIRLAGDSLTFVPLPLSFLNQGYLLIDADHSQREAEDQTGQTVQSAQLFELHLQLEGLGNLQIDIRQKDGGVSLKFLTEDIERAKFLAGYRDELGQWLTHASLESAQFLVGAKEPVKSLLEKIMSGATGMVDTKA